MFIKLKLKANFLKSPDPMRCSKCSEFNADPVQLSVTTGEAIISGRCQRVQLQTSTREYLDGCDIANEQKLNYLDLTSKCNNNQDTDRKKIWIFL